MPVEPGSPCADCGHAKHLHFGRENTGPCLAAHKLKSGKYADATVCPCSTYREKS